MSACAGSNYTPVVNGCLRGRRTREPAASLVRVTLRARLGSTGWYHLSEEQREKLTRQEESFCVLETFINEK